jgi:gliding motility-associated-like protein
MQIEVFPTPTTDFNFSNKVCEGQETRIEQASNIAYGGFSSFEWLVVSDSVTASGSSFDYLFDEVGNHPVRLTVTSEDGCVDHITKDVSVFETPVADFRFNNVCEDVAINFRDSSRFSGAIANYTWKFDDGSDWNQEQYPTHVYDTFGVYDVTLIVASHKECVDSITYPIEVYERVNPRFEAVQDTGCSPFTVELINNTVTQTGPDLTYTWTYMDNVKRVDTAYYTYTNLSGKAKSFDIRLDVTSGQGCFSTYMVEDFITVLPQPVAYFEADKELTGILTTDPLVQFTNMSQQENRVFWDFGDGATSTVQNPAHQFAFEGEYEVVLEAKNFMNCVDSFSAKAQVIHENTPFIPSAFTPNDDGLNDVFFIQGLQDVSSVSMEIYDRWGNQIFYGEGKDVQWDGYDMQSRIVQQGVYAYRVVYEDRDGKEYEFQGNVTVLGVNQ